MMLDFGADPRVIGEMSMAEIMGLMGAIQRRRGKAKMPTEEEEAEATQAFAALVANDPSVRLN